jgi:hypothetical protein
MIRERVAKYADIDTRRALGIFGRLPVTNFVPHPLPIESWRYWPATRTAIFFNADPENFEFEVHKGLVFDGEYWSYEERSRVSTTRKRGQRYLFSEYEPQLIALNFSFAENPQFITE